MEPALTAQPVSEVQVLQPPGVTAPRQMALKAGGYGPSARPEDGMALAVAALGLRTSEF